MATYTIRIEHDPDVESPCEWDQQWMLYSFSRRHSNVKDYHQYFDAKGRPKIHLRRRMDVGLAFVLDYYEHGMGAWSITGEGMQCPWDTAKRGGILVWEHGPSALGAKTLEERAKDARQFLETYNSWMNGETYWYDIESDDGFTDSCGGFIGWDHLTDGIASVLADDLQVEDLLVVSSIVDSGHAERRIASLIAGRRKEVAK